MKKIFKIMFILIATGTLFYSCERLSYFEQTAKTPAASADYYVQFIKAAQSFETGVSEAGALVEVEKPIAVVLMGVPQSQDITVNLAISSTSTITPAMYTLSATSITIPAGKTSGSVTLKTKAASMPVGVNLKLVLTIDAGAHNSPNVKATTLTYNLKRLAFCPLTSGVASLVGTYAGDDAGYPVSIGAIVSGTKLKVSGIGEEFMADFWGEPKVSGGDFLMTITANGFIDIPRQYIFTTVWDGDLYEYEIKGSGKWENCGGQPKLIFNYDIYYPGDTDGVAKSYAGVPYLTAEITRGAKKSAQASKGLLGRAVR